MEGKKNCGAQLYSFTLKRDNYSFLISIYGCNSRLPFPLGTRNEKGAREAY